MQQWTAIFAAGRTEWTAWNIFKVDLRQASTGRCVLEQRSTAAHGNHVRATCMIERSSYPEHDVRRTARPEVGR